MNISLGEQIPALTWVMELERRAAVTTAMRANMGRGRKLHTLVSFVLHSGEMGRSGPKETSLPHTSKAITGNMHPTAEAIRLNKER